MPFDPIDQDLDRHFTRQEAEDTEFDIRAGLEATVLAERVGMIRQQLAKPGSVISTVLQDVDSDTEWHDKLDGLVRYTAATPHASDVGQRFREWVEGMMLIAAREGLDAAVATRAREVVAA